jgi:cysteinyl-tRNA synthetase
MVLRLFNSMGRRLVPFVPLRKGEVRMYTCGPTVWNYAHVGNFRTFLFEDVLRRYLLYKGFRVTQVKNITDVEDRIIRGMKQTGKSREELTEFYTEAFMEDLTALNVQRAEHYPRATENIAGMVEMIKSLVKLGYAYKADDGSYYYSIRKFKRYGRLSGVKVTGLKPGARVAVDDYTKLGPQDFALWKAWDKNDGEVFWETELGKGRPGWHIECSAMARRYLGDSFDIHTGGKDLKFPHHENEIAQSEALTGKRLAKYWLHAEFLRVRGEEMHKSLGNIVTIHELREKGWSPRAIRLFLLSAHYRDELNLTDESLGQADSNVSKLDQFISRLQAVKDGEEEGAASRLAPALTRDLSRAMDDDLNTPKALAALFTFVRKTNVLLDAAKVSKGDAETLLKALRDIDAVLGVMRFEGTSVSDSILSLIKQREEARSRRDYEASDRIREELRKLGVVIEDTPKGTIWRKV